MNKQRRTLLHAVLDGLAKLRDPINKEEVVKILQKAQGDISWCSDMEEEALDNRPETFRWSALNDTMSENVSDLAEVNDDLDELIDICTNDATYSYDAIKSDIAKIVNKIKQVIHR